MIIKVSFAFFNYGILLLFDFVEELQTYFEQFGKVVEVVLKSDRDTGLPRGFGFVGFADPTSVDKVGIDIASEILCKISFSKSYIQCI